VQCMGDSLVAWADNKRFGQELAVGQIKASVEDGVFTLFGRACPRPQVLTIVCKLGGQPARGGILDSTCSGCRIHMENAH